MGFGADRLRSFSKDKDDLKCPHAMVVLNRKETVNDAASEISIALL
jgi:hypothetical protein